MKRRSNTIKRIVPQLPGAKEVEIQFEHVTPLSAAALDALGLAQKHRPAIGDAWVLPSPSDEGGSCSRHLMKGWWKKAGLEGPSDSYQVLPDG